MRKIRENQLLFAFILFFLSVFWIGLYQGFKYLRFVQFCKENPHAYGCGPFGSLRK